MSAKDRVFDGGLVVASKVPGVRRLHQQALSIETEHERGVWFQEGAKSVVLHRLDTAGLEVFGEENIPPAGPVIIAPSHVDQTDPFAAAHLMLRYRPELFFRILAKHQLDRPLLSDALWGTAEFYNRIKPADQEMSDRHVDTATKMRILAEAVAEVDDGEGAGMIFPWGTRERRGSLPVKIGVFLLASELADIRDESVPILPIGLWGNKLGRYALHMLEEHPRPCVTGVVGKPLYIHPGFRQKITEQGFGGIDVLPQRELLRGRLHDLTLHARTAQGVTSQYKWLDEPSDKKKRRRVRASSSNPS